MTIITTQLPPNQFRWICCPVCGFTLKTMHNFDRQIGDVGTYMCGGNPMRHARHYRVHYIAHASRQCYIVAEGSPSIVLEEAFAKAKLFASLEPVG